MGSEKGVVAALSLLQLSYCRHKLRKERTRNKMPYYWNSFFRIVGLSYALMHYGNIYLFHSDGNGRLRMRRGEGGGRGMGREGGRLGRRGWEREGGSRRGRGEVAMGKQ